MKKICMSLFLMMVPMATFPYKITNSPASTVSTRVLLKKPGFSIKKFFKGPNEAEYMLKPGESGAWNQNEIRKKLKVNDLRLVCLNASTIASIQPPYFSIDKMPINANLEILVIEAGGKIVGGAIDHRTGKIYNQKGFDQAIQRVKQYWPDKLSSITSLIQRSNIK